MTQEDALAFARICLQEHEAEESFSVRLFDKDTLDTIEGAFQKLGHATTVEDMTLNVTIQPIAGS